MRFKQILAHIVLFASITFGQSNTQEWPAWFLYPQRYPALILGYGDFNHGARKSAEEMFRADSKTKLKGSVTYYFDNNNEDTGKITNLSSETDSSISIPAELFSFQKFYLNVLTGEYLEAFTPDTLHIDSTYYINSDEIAKPLWIAKEYYEDDNYFYGVGCFTSMGRVTDAWQTAEEQAVLAIIKSSYNSVFQIKSSEKYDLRTTLDEKIIVSKFNCEFSDLKIMERYPDWKDKLYYVLVRIPKINLIINK